MTILELQMTLKQKRLYLKLTRNSFCIFFSANDIVSCREFISSPLHVRLQQLRYVQPAAQSKVLCGPF